MRARRNGKPWTGADIFRLTAMAERELSADRIATRLQRSESAVKAEAARQRLKLVPSDKLPTATEAASRTRRSGTRASRSQRERLF